MTGRGTNGLHPLEVYSTRQKCKTHPSKRQFQTSEEATRMAIDRSKAAKMPIVAYACDDCGYFHLTSRPSNDKVVTKEGGVISTRAIERRTPADVAPLVARLELPDAENDEVDPETLPLVYGNKGARVKALAAFVEGKDRVTTTELVEEIGVGRQIISEYMKSLGWKVHAGRFAHWYLPKESQVEVEAVVVEPDVPVEEPVVEEPRIKLSLVTPEAAEKAQAFADQELKASVRRHPAAQVAGWRPMENLDRLRHIPLGDLLDTLQVAGLEVRIQVREHS